MDDDETPGMPLQPVVLSGQDDPEHDGTWVPLAMVEEEMSAMADRIAFLDGELVKERTRRERAEAKAAHWLRQAAWANGGALPDEDIVFVPDPTVEPEPEPEPEPRRRRWWQR